MKTTLVILLLALAATTTAQESSAKKKPVMADLLENSTSNDWRPLNASNLIYMELGNGTVIIELAPEFAPNHVNNIKALVKEKFWDGLAVVRSQDNYVVQWGDPKSEKEEEKRKVKEAKETLPPEFDLAMDANMTFAPLGDKDAYSKEVGFINGFAVGRDPKAKKMWLLHCYGAVGVGRGAEADSGGGTELYAVIGHAPRHLDRNATVVGRVVHGIEVLSVLPRGKDKLGFYEKPEQNIPIRSVRMAADVPAKERVDLEILRTDTGLFRHLIEARRNRSEEWFHFRAGGVDICNVPIPIREIKKAKKARPTKGKSSTSKDDKEFLESDTKQ